MMRKSLLVGAAMAGIFLASAPNASAAVACVGPVCWHSHEEIRISTGCKRHCSPR